MNPAGIDPSRFESVAELAEALAHAAANGDGPAAKLATDLVAKLMEQELVDDGAPKATVFSLADARRRRGDGSPKGGGR